MTHSKKAQFMAEALFEQICEGQDMIVLSDFICLDQMSEVNAVSASYFEPQSDSYFTNDNSYFAAPFSILHMEGVELDCLDSPLFAELAKVGDTV